ncbi:putative ABC transport system ATP-binding protein [Paucibacter oligotrophus]|uniref:Putative ABC transport system ATP-binding protein n=1 Tax=Roseateles oligotrophus TaxID=1769250 RepID=A0A840L0R9_9BURK|nr:ATP-binding cassette domain-containing protein [Roseateles oligotrophus]MBB4841516.1 putative ABC transport system ATP-binding protein [Roseateles oligotrophus]
MSDTGSPPLLQVQGLSHHYPGSQRSLRFADFELAAGQHLLLRGNSGSGKSTLLALLAGLLTPASGEVRVQGRALSGLSQRQRDAWRGEFLGFVPQRLHLSPALTVMQSLQLPFLSVGLAADLPRAQALLQRLGLAEMAGRHPHQLSVGQAQRVALARALMRRPRLLMADEPSASLDDANTAQVLRLLQEAAAEQGASLLLATHDGRIAAQWSARSLVLPDLAGGAA